MPRRRRPSTSDAAVAARSSAVAWLTRMERRPLNAGLCSACRAPDADTYAARLARDPIRAIGRALQAAAAENA